MHNSVRSYIALAVAFASLMVCCVSAGPVLNYQGRITSGEGGFSGFGQFKFVLINEANQTVWSNDGSSGTGQPASSVSVNVDNGLFQVNLGDETTMQPIPGIVMHERSLRLRIWFSDGQSGFEQFSPDTEINALNFSQIDTGNLLTVDGDGRGTYDSIQAAVDYASTNWGTAILIMPGQYNESIVFPSNCFVTLRGAVAGGAVRINSEANTLSIPEGAQVRIEDLSVSGSPALSDQGMQSNSWREITLRNCELSSSSQESSSPVIALENSTHLNLIDSRVDAHGQGSAVSVGGGSNVEATRSRFWANAAAAALLLQSGNPNVRMDDCDLHAALLAQENGGWGSFKNCRFNGITLEDSAGGLSFEGCQFSSPNENHAVRITGGHSSVQFNNCQFYSSQATTFYMKDAPGWVDLQSCRMNASDAGVIEMIASSEIDLGEDEDEVYLNLRNCVVSANGNGEAPAVKLSNTYEGDLELEFEAIWCDIMGNIRDGVEIGSGCGFCAEHSLVEGNRNAVYAPDGGQIDLNKCNVFGAEELPGAGVYMGGEGFLFSQGCDIEGEDEGGGVFLDFQEGGKAVMVQNMIGGFGDSALVVTGGTVQVTHSTFITAGSPMLSLAGTNAVHRFNHCTFKSVVDLLDDEEPRPVQGPAVMLSGPQGETPVPQFFDCSFEPADDVDYAIALDEAASGNIVLINSQLLKPVAPQISNNGPDIDEWGNAVFNP
ncbi:MAG: right-handed parallel beta-helix repeat-containing protein [Pontiellaceae bacterium]|nr:right-handed parallel beta-helix repeat-containing protein [Pontiellaceae bacterium]